MQPLRYVITLIAMSTLTTSLVACVDSGTMLRSGTLNPDVNSICGNGIIEEGEICDDGAQNGQPGFCDDQCTAIVSATCGNGIIEDGELCDDGPDNGLPGHCANNCLEFVSATCGNGILEDGEVCDDGDQNGEPLHCATDCRGTTPATCGNGIIENGEICDDGDQNGEPLGCAEDCSGITPSVCGNGVIEDGEICDDGPDNGEPFGCADDCSGVTPPVCGNGVIEDGEICDDGPNNGEPFFCATDCQGRADLGEGDGRDVIFVGDSWMNLVGFGELSIVPPGLDPRIYETVPSGIQQTTIVASGNRPYRQYGVPGTKLLDEVIPDQYYTAVDDDPVINTIVMTGGGNDILLDMPDLSLYSILRPISSTFDILNSSATINCSLWSGTFVPNIPILPNVPFLQEGIQLLFDSPLAAQLDRTGAQCRQRIDQVAERYDTLLDDMAANGTQDIIIVIYTRHTFVGPKPINYVWETVGPLCTDVERGDMRCHLVDADVVNDGGPVTLLEGIHPNGEGYDLIGKYVYNLMVEEGMRR